MVGVINTLSTLVYLPAAGLMNGAGPIFGYYQGAGREADSRRLFYRIVAAMTVYFVAATAVVELWPEALLGVFSNDAVLIAYGVRPLRVFLVLTVLAAAQMVPPGYFQAVGRAGAATVLNLVRPLVLLAGILWFPALWGFDGFLASGPVSDAAGVAVALAFTVSDRTVGRPRTVDSPSHLP